MFGFGEKTIETVTKEALKLPHKEIAYFCWLCGIRVLPFLGEEGHFDYWEPKLREHHLWSAFRALDFAAVNANVNADPQFPTLGQNLFNSASQVCPATRDSTYDIYTKRMNYVGKLRDAKLRGEQPIIYDVYSAAALNCRIPANPQDFYTADAIYDARQEHATYAAATLDSIYATIDVIVDKNAAVDVAEFAEIAVGTKNDAFIDIMLDDIHRLKSGNMSGFNRDISRYGQVWSNFQNVLSGANSYWGRLYARLFAKGLVLDEEEKRKLRRRLSMPDNVVGLGASDIAKILERMENR
jgi:hypothetical protein